MQDGLKTTLDAKQGCPPLSLRRSSRRAKSESVFGVDLIDRRPFELPLDRRYYADLRVTPGAKGWFHRAHLHSASPAVPSICIQYCGFMSLCQRELSRGGCWPVVAADRAAMETHFDLIGCEG